MEIDQLDNGGNISLITTNYLSTDKNTTITTTTTNWIQFN